MAYTWSEIKKAALDLMFTTEEASDAAAYIAAMPEAANFALRDLASVCRPIIKKYSISHAPVANMLGDALTQFDLEQSQGSDIIYAAQDPKAYYFEVDAPCTVLLEQVQDDNSTLTITSVVHTGSGSFTAYSGLIALTGEIQLRFLGEYAYNIRNVAFYALPFASVSNIPPFTRHDRYALKTLIGVGFKKLAPNSVVLTGNGQHRRSDEFQLEPDDTLVIEHYTVAQFDIFYEAYPTPITSATDDEYELDGDGGLPAEALDLLPLYIAGRLFAEDNPGQAASYRNQYNVRRAELSADKSPVGDTEWECKSGWW
jgi:hypothetical protein